MPKVDVIIPAYNAAKYLPIAIESVEAQTFDDWHIVLVDDGSTDNTASLVAPFRERLGGKLTFIQQPNRGLPAARNAAIRNSSAEFLALLDADDVWLPCRLEESLRSFERRPQAGLSHGQISYIAPDGSLARTVRLDPKLGEGRIAPLIYTRRVHLPCPTITFRRRCVDDVGMFDETMRATEDRDLWFRIAQQYEVCFIDRVIAHYRFSPNSMTSDIGRMLQAQLQFVEKHYREPGCGFLQRREALGSIYKQIAEALGNRGQSRAALNNALRALWFNPLNAANLQTTGSLLLRSAGWKR